MPPISAALFSVEPEGWRRERDGWHLVAVAEGFELRRKLDDLSVDVSLVAIGLGDVITVHDLEACARASIRLGHEVVAVIAGEAEPPELLVGVEP
jgi:hypothetical protein